MLKTIVRTVLLVVIVLVIAFVLLVAGFRLMRSRDRKVQAARIEWLGNAGGQSLSLRDSLIAGDVPINRIRYLATHNSYHLQAGLLQLLLLDLFEPGEAAKLKYSHLDPYTQLEIGVRSFEFDLRYYGKSSFESVHVPLVDNRSNSPVFSEALEEIKLWSERNPAHVPVIIIMELKDDWRILDPFQKKWTAEALLELDGQIAEHLDGKLTVPADLSSDGESLRDSLLKNGWPPLSACRGRFIFVYHESDGDYFNDEYLSNSGRVSFVMKGPDSPEASFILRNEPDSGDIPDLVSRGFIVRTRADADCVVSEERKNRAIASGAQIVSTDFPSGYASGGNYSLGWNELLRRYVY